MIQCGRSFEGRRSSSCALPLLGELAGHWLGGGELLLMHHLLHTFIFYFFFSFILSPVPLEMGGVSEQLCGD